MYKCARAHTLSPSNALIYDTTESERDSGEFMYVNKTISVCVCCTLRHANVTALWPVDLTILRRKKKRNNAAPLGRAPVCGVINKIYSNFSVHYVVTLLLFN